jgi:hypothetical protein
MATTARTGRSPPVPRGAPRTYDVDVAALDLDELEERLRAAGQSPRTIRGILAYALLVQAGRKVDIPPPSESRYRRFICEAYGIPPGPPPRIGNPKLATVTPLPARQRGSAKVGAMVAGLACSAVAVLGAHSASAAPRSPSPAFERQEPIIPVMSTRFAR